jgi:hypothetical protein
MSMQSLLDQLLRSGLGGLAGGATGTAPAAGGTGGGHLGKYATGAAAGGALALLLGSKRGRKMGGKVLKYGTAAALGAVAWRRTLYDKLWDEHVVHTEEDGTAVLYIDRHLVHEVTSPQAFEGLRGRPQGLARQLDGGHRRPQHPHHRLGTGLRRHHRPDQQEQITTLDANIAEFGAAAYFPFLSTSARASCTSSAPKTAPPCPA